jgi:hypothetical protein
MMASCPEQVLSTCAWKCLKEGIFVHICLCSLKQNIIFSL